MTTDHRTLAVIRTHRWDEDAARLCDQLRPVFGSNLVVAFQNRPAGISPPIPVIDIDDGWLRAHGLRVVVDWGWRCGDYFLYRAREAFPNHDRYWMIEPDVLFTGPVGDFFAEAAALPAAVLGASIARLDPRHRFAQGMPAITLYRSIFAMTRFSGPALDRLADRRRASAADRIAPRFFPNDEIFCFSHAMAMPDLPCTSLDAAMPGWVDPAQLATDPDILVDLLEGRTTPGIFHPVRCRRSFMRAVAARAAQNTHFIAKVRPSLQRLTDAEIEMIADDARAHCLHALMRGRPS